MRDYAIWSEAGPGRLAATSCRLLSLRSTEPDAEEALWSEVLVMRALAEAMTREAGCDSDHKRHTGVHAPLDCLCTFLLTLYFYCSNYTITVLIYLNIFIN